MATDLAALRLSPTVHGVAAELGNAPVPAREVITRVLARHRSDYAGGRAPTVQWPTTSRTAPTAAWLDEANGLFSFDAGTPLHGRAVILGLALVDPPTGRRMVEGGLFYALVSELSPPLLTMLSERGVALLRAIPLAAAAAGVDPFSYKHDGVVTSIAFDPTGTRLVSGGGDHKARVWHLETEEEYGTFDHDSRVNSVAFDPSGVWVATGDDHRATVRLLGGAEPRTFPHDGSVREVVFSPDGTLLATASSDGTARLFDRATGEQLFQDVLPHALYHVAFTSDGERFAAVGEDGVLRTWSTSAPSTPIFEVTHGVAVWALAAGPDGAHLATADRNGAVRVFDARGGEEVMRFAHDAEVGAIVFSPDGRRLATGSNDGTARIWDLVTQSPLARLSHGGVVGAVAFSPDGRQLVSGSSSDGSARLWNVQTHELIARLPHTNGAGVLALSPDGSRLATGGGDGVVKVWSVDLGDEHRGRLPGYSPDEATPEEDFVGIGDEVQALATLIAAKSVVPPLSIGLFGDWGSGKTFFMRCLMRRVDELSRAARASRVLQKEIAFYKHIVQIEFNAWHYSQGELWPSLVEHLLANLKVAPEEQPNIVEKRQEHIIEQLGRAEAAEAKTERERDSAVARANELETELRTLETEHERQREQLAAATAADPTAGIELGDEVKRNVTAVLDAVGLREVGESAADLLNAVADARVVLERGNRVLVPLARAKDQRKRFLLLLAVVAGAPLVGLVLGLAVHAVAGDATAAFSGVATSIAALLGGAAGWVRSQTEWTSRRLEEIERAQHALEQPLERLRAEQEKERLALEKELELATERVRGAQQALNAQRERVAALEAELKAATPAREMARLIQDRAASDDYRRYLGVLALIRRDFAQLSDYLQLENAKLEGYRDVADEQKDADVRINRIVLYIDDLDRCERAKVVEVLQAIHLLLAFPLFVVVVGVDVRWITRSLALEYTELLRDSDANGDSPQVEGATPRDYLEKIFQIPFWLEPLEPEASQRLIRGLVGARETSDAGITSQEVGRGDGRAAAAAGRAVSAQPVAPAAGATVAPSHGAAAPRADLNPESLEIHPFELAFMEQLSPLLGQSPREVKRFVNLYRLIKTRVPDLDHFLSQQGPLPPFRSVLFLLAVETGLPALAGMFFDGLRTGATGVTSSLVSSLSPRGAEAIEEKVRLERWFSTPDGEAVRDASIDPLRAWLPEVLRFSFRTHQI